MAWTTTSDFAVGHVVTAAEWNALAGVTGNTQFLKDKFDNFTSGATTGRAFNTVYQNTTGKIAIENVAVAVDSGAAAGSAIVVMLCSSTNPPTVIKTDFGIVSVPLNQTYRGNVTCHVPLNFYFTASTTLAGTGTATLRNWSEDLL